MSYALSDIMGAAGSLLDGKYRRTMKRAARSGMSGGRTVRGALSALRHLDLDDVLAWAHLARRRGPLGAVALFGAGAAIGAGLVMLLSPAAGPDVRRSLRRRAAGLEEEAKNRIEDAADAVKDVERKVEDRVTEALRTARESAKTKPD